MQTCNQIESPNSAIMPPDFPKQVHQALKDWHAPAAHSNLTTLRLCQEIQAQRNLADPHTAINQLLLDALEWLRKTTPEAADLLQRRFLDQQTAQAVAYSLNATEDIIYQNQRKAIKNLAHLIWEQEQALRVSSVQKRLARLETPTYTQLFGIAPTLASLREQLESATTPWILALEGIGGIGKTTLADALARDLAYRQYFTEILWISARQRMFHPSGRIETVPQPPRLTLTELIEHIIEQLAPSALQRQSDAVKRNAALTLLKEQPCLIVVDNLETVEDYAALAPQLHEFTQPSKFLLTTRYSLRGERGIYIVSVPGLAEADSLALLRYEAESQGLSELARASDAELRPFYQATGGNPLALKMLIGQLHTFEIPTILQWFATADGQMHQELLDFIYQEAWQQLEENSKRVLQALLLVADAGGAIEQISAAVELDSLTTQRCLQKLATLSLVEIKGDLYTKRYALHPLTQLFVTRQSLGGEPLAQHHPG